MTTRSDKLAYVVAAVFFGIVTYLAFDMHGFFQAFVVGAAWTSLLTAADR